MRLWSWMAVALGETRTQGQSDPFDEMFDGVNGVARGAASYLFGFLLVVVLLLVGVYCLYRAARTERRYDSPVRYLVGGLVSLGAGLGLGAFGYMQASEALRPYGLTVGGVVVAVIAVGALVASRR